MLDFLLELRRRIQYILIFFTINFIVFYYYASPLFQMVIAPLVRALPQDSKIIAIKITASIITPFQLATDIALFFTAPFALFQLWCFAAPGLYKQERFILRRTIVFSFLLFGLGILFCFFLILPFMFQLFTKSLPSNVQLMPDMATAINFILSTLLTFGFCFQLPLICLTLVHLGWINTMSLRRLRPYAIVASFVIGMLLTPPDVISQIMLAVPLCLLYELGIILASLRVKNSKL